MGGPIMSDTVRRVRAETGLRARRIGMFPMASKRYAPRSWFPVHPWGYYVNTYASLDRPRRIRPPRTRSINQHAVNNALQIAAWGPHTCQAFPCQAFPEMT